MLVEYRRRWFPCLDSGTYLNAPKSICFEIVTSDGIFIVIAKLSLVYHFVTPINYYSQLTTQTHAFNMKPSLTFYLYLWSREATLWTWILAPGSSLNFVFILLNTNALNIKSPLTFYSYLSKGANQRFEHGTSLNFLPVLMKTLMQRYKHEWRRKPTL